MPRKELKDGIPLSEICRQVGGELHGNPAASVRGLCTLEEPEKNCLAFVRSQHLSKTLKALADSGVAGVLIPAGAVWEQSTALNLIVVKDPLAAEVKLMPLFFSLRAPTRVISELAHIDPTAEIGKNLTVGPFSWIGADCVIDDNVTIYSNVSIYPGARIGTGSVIYSGVSIREDCIVGANCIIHDGTVIGADGFGYFPDPARGLCKVPQMGNVKIEDGVEIGANSCIDRATLGTTRIGANTKLDNLVQIGHNVTIGQSTIICGNARVGGSVRIGNQVVTGGGVSIADHSTIADGVRIGGHSGVHSSIEEKGDYAGYPVVTAGQWRRQSAALAQLPGLLHKLKGLLKGQDESD